MNLVGRATWNPAIYKELGVKKGSRLLILVIDQESEEAFGEELKTVSRAQHDRFLRALEAWDKIPPGERPARPTYEQNAVELELVVKVHYSKRSIDSNALYWTILEMEANWLNGTPNYRHGYWSKKLPGEIITPKQIHDDDLETYCEKSYLDVPEKDAFALRRAIESGMGRVKSIEPLTGGKVRIHIWKTTRYMNTKEFHIWVQRVIDRIRDEGSLLRTDVPQFIALKNDFLDLIKGKKKEKKPR